MSRTRKDRIKRGYRDRGARRIRVRGVRRDVVDYRKLSRALIELEIHRARAERDAAAESPTSSPGEGDAR